MKPTLETIAIVFSLLTFLGGVSAWYSASIIKKYAAQRDFEHLQRNYLQLASNLAQMEKDFDQRFDQISLMLTETKGIGMAILAKCGNENSMGWTRSKGE